MKRIYISFVIVLSMGIQFLPSAIASKPKPSLKQIEGAKEAEAAKRAAAVKGAIKLREATDTLQSLTKKANAAQVLYVRSQAELAIAIKNSKAAASHVAETQATVTETHRTIGKLAAASYKLGGGLSDIEPLLSANGPQEMIDRLSTLNTLGSNNKVALKRFKVAEGAARIAKIQAYAAERAQQFALEKVGSAKIVADETKIAQQQEVDKLQSVQDKLMKELASARRVRTTLEQQRQLALLEEQKAKEATKVPNQRKVWKVSLSGGQSSFRSNVTMRAKAVEFAKRQVLAGKPYVWGAEGPNAFDCSGLIYAAYKFAGLGWPSWDRLNAALYTGYTKHLPLSQMQPGDLLFYSFDGSISNIHHMSIYAGNGMMWEARSTRTGLRYSNIYSVDGMMPFVGRV